MVHMLFRPSKAVLRHEAPSTLVQVQAQAQAQAQVPVWPRVWPRTAAQQPQTLLQRWHGLERRCHGSQPP